ncbi:hypothetical protein BDZ85DRAFT_46012 [Elsinoe ampelina]|uniref:Uncharacterized protein n=1 Tax=Elsinoe ampelina TaxID=302913 RepID=A0A6A6G0M6_9PEZI|nr:hypothetical protein BDZ85DRAFT_59358 [Elsinoe ampelina]KAF2219217.1 hypothetical protein BDZ85DRAFT_46012 [Elsinoe ampelina]
MSAIDTDSGQVDFAQSQNGQEQGTQCHEQGRVRSDRFLYLHPRTVSLMRFQMYITMSDISKRRHHRQPILHNERQTTQGQLQSHRGGQESHTELFQEPIFQRQWRRDRRRRLQHSQPPLLEPCRRRCRREPPHFRRSRGQPGDPGHIRAELYFRQHRRDLPESHLPRKHQPLPLDVQPGSMDRQRHLHPAGTPQWSRRVERHHRAHGQDDRCRQDEADQLRVRGRGRRAGQSRVQGHGGQSWRRLLLEDRQSGVQCDGLRDASLWSI